MIAVSLSRSLESRRIHYGWIMVAVTFLTMLVTAGAVGGPAVLLLPLQREFGWSNAEISSALAIRLVFFGLMGPFTASLMNTFGLRKVTLASLAIVVTGLGLSLFMTELWQLILLWGVVAGFGTGLTALVLGATVATRWFTERRGLVIGFLTASSATGQLVFMPLISWIAENHGWRGGILLLCMLLAATAFLVFLLLRDRPADLGLAPYGEKAVVPHVALAHSFRAIAGAPIATLRDAAQTRVFWVLFATFFICGASTNGLIQPHLIPLCVDFGLPELQGAGFLAMIGIFDFLGTIASGWLSDRYDNRWLLFWYYGLRGLSLLYLPASDFTFYGLSLFAVFYGLDWVATVPPTVKLTAERFGRERANLVFGWVFAGHQLGAACAAYGAGLSRSELDSYLPAFFTAGTLCLIAAALAISIKRRVA